MRFRILLVSTLLAVPSTLFAQVTQVPRANVFNPDMERARRHYDAGWTLVHSEDWGGAVKEFQQVIEIDPKFANAYYSLGRAHMGMRQYSKAIDAYTKCRELFLANTGDIVSNQLNGTRRLEDQILEQRMALQQAQQASGPKSQNQSSQLYIRELNNKINQLEQARNRNQNLVVDTSVPYYVPLALGAAYYRSRQFEDAEREYKAAIEANSESGEAHNNLAVLYMDSGRLEDAKGELLLAEKTGFKVNPGLKQDLEAKRKGR